MGRGINKRLFENPIFDWFEWEIWEYIEENNLPYCSLYDEGFHRLGCVICPFLTYRQHQIHKQRWPKPVSYTHLTLPTN